jgi:outer membrane receptor protein involved in Fe transport
MNKIPRQIIINAGLLALSAFNLEGQESEKQEPVFELSPFEVTSTENQGYAITDTNSATRFSVDVRDLPFSISSLSSAVLEDAAAIDAIETLNLSSSATPTENVFTGNSNRPFIRGTSSARFFVDGMFFNSLVAPGNIAVDRVEILKGTSAMLYGQGEPGGTINYTLKKPLKETSGRIQMMLGNYDEKYATVDFSTPLNKSKSLGVRFGYSYFYGENEHDRYSSEKQDAYARIRWEYDGYDRFIDFYHIHSNAHNEGLVQHILDGYHGITNLAMKADIFTRFTINDLPNPLDLGMIDPESHNDAAEGSFADVQTNSSTLTLNHRINDTFVVRATYNHTEMPRYLLRNLADPLRAVETQESRTYLITDPETGFPSLFETKRGDIVKNFGGQMRDDKLISDAFAVNLLGEFRFKYFTWKVALGFDHVSEVFETQSLYSEWHYNQLGNGTAGLKEFGGRIPVVLGNVFRPEEGLVAASEPLSTYTVQSGFIANENVGSGYYTTQFLQFFEGNLTIVGSARYDEGEIRSDACVRRGPMAKIRIFAVSPVRTSRLPTPSAGTGFSFGILAFSPTTRPLSSRMSPSGMVAISSPFPLLIENRLRVKVGMLASSMARMMGKFLPC